MATLTRISQSSGGSAKGGKGRPGPESAACYGLGFGVQGLGFRVQGLGFRV